MDLIAFLAECRSIITYIKSGKSRMSYDSNRKFTITLKNFKCYYYTDLLFLYINSNQTCLAETYSKLLLYGEHYFLRHTHPVSFSDPVENVV